MVEDKSKILDYAITALMFVAYLLLVVFLIVLGQITSETGEKVFYNSTFFQSGNKFTILGLNFDSRGYFYIFMGFFFLNSLIFNLNVSVINPVFQRIVFNMNDNVEISSEQQFRLSALLVIYDVWSAFRSLFSIIGVTSNIWFFLSNTMGFLIGDLFIRNMYIKYPESFKFNYHKISGPTPKVMPGSAPLFTSSIMHSITGSCFPIRKGRVSADDL